ncbi:hypothetical protein ACFPAF_10290 [Hymenobacter endophyticus]|uniref:Uncharacterized protein n=1 Tax=Hymenobacter endophyticus TaxID=3076335 RepID=A0ABU3THD5_9BACT|nr:hypothetical protein [Hymenobacter endophyticus]MDU0370783.1 hypothetical protein [Hymenobacter endophyticus]
MKFRLFLSHCRSLRALRAAPLALLGGCAAVGQLDTLPEGRYRAIQTNDAALHARLPLGQPVYARQSADTLYLLPDSLSHKAPAPDMPLYYRLQPGRHVVLAARRFDLDVFTIPFKIRPPRAGLPVQLNSNFNAALYLGRRLDFYHLTSHRQVGGQRRPLVRTTGLGYGLFTGLGSSAITPDFTRQHATTDYEGFVLHVGAATIYDAHIFNLGLAVGADHLLGPDGSHWIYQHRPWFGVLFGLDLN